MRSEVLTEGLEPANDVLRRIGAIDPDDHPLAAPLLELARLREDVIAAGQLVELGGVDRDRVRGGEGASPRVLDRTGLDIDVGAENGLDRGQEVVAPVPGVE